MTQDNIKISSSTKFAIFTLIIMISIIGLSDQNAFAVIGTPTVSPIGHSFITDSGDIIVTFHPSVSTNEIRYTTDGSDPTLNSEFASEGDTIAINTSDGIQTILKFAETDGTTLGSIFSETYTPTDAQTVNVHTETGSTEQVTPNTDAGAFDNFVAESESQLPSTDEAAKPPGLDFPFGLFLFTISGVGNGGTADVTLTFAENLPKGTQYWDDNGGVWTNITDKVTISGNTITLRLTDGGVGDDNSAVGKITDPGGPVIIVNPKSHSENIVPSEAVPSLGGTDTHHFTDGLTINGKIFDIGHYNTNIKQQQFKVGQPVSITIKSEPIYGSTTWQHVATYFDFNGKDLLVSNADTALVLDKTDGFQSIDPNGFISNANAVTKTTPDTVYTTFTFTVQKQMDDTDMIIRVWDDSRYTLDAKVLGAMVFGVQKAPEPAKIPDYIKIYPTLKDADNAVEGTGFIKPVLFAHISTTSQIWSEPNTGHVLWFFDTKDNEVARIVYGINGNMIREDAEKLVQAPTILIGKDTSYAGNHLDRYNVAQMEQAQKDQEMIALMRLESFGHPVYYSK